MRRLLPSVFMAWLLCCAQSLLAQDLIPPVIFCPADLTVQLEPSDCEEQVFFSIFATDDQSVPVISQIDATGLSSGDDFPVGQWTLSFRAVDAAGNADTCDFVVTVEAFEPASPGLVCDGDLNISIPANCFMILTPGMVLEGDYGCYDDFTVNVEGTGTPYIGQSYVGEEITYTVTNTQTGVWCWGEAFVEDKAGPFIQNCDSVNINCLQDARSDYEGGDVPVPTFSDCFPFTVVYMDMATQGTCNDDFSQIIMRMWTATDELGNVSTCSQIITIERISLTDLTPDCPADLTVECVPGVTPNFDPALTGYPFDTIDGVVYQITENALSFCNITASYSDQIIPGCGASYRILRTWTIFDWCLPVDMIDNPHTCKQILWFRDNTAPVIIAPANMTVSANLPGCRARPVIPAATIYDCSNYTVSIITPVGVISGNGGQVPAPGLPIGIHTLTYKATDACGNSSSQTITVTVVDQTKPTPVCDTETTVALDDDGYAYAEAITFDDGSLDNCCIDEFQVRRMTDNCGIPANTTFRDYVEFCCADVSADVPVILRVYDCHGNFNECMVTVQVQDKAPPSLTCPPDITLTCGQNVNDLDLTGEVVTNPALQGNNDGLALDNCNPVTITRSDVGSVTCGSGVIFRTWRATDGAGLFSTCIQKITVVNNSPFIGNSIVWPPDVTVYGCSAATDPGSAGSPGLPPNSPCYTLVTGYQDQLFTSVPDACRKILRTWTVIDWCVYQPNQPNSPGIWQHVQVIKVIDQDAPVFTACVNRTFCNFKVDCSSIAPDLTVAATDGCTAAAQLHYSWTVDLYNDNFPNIGPAYSGTGQNINNFYPVGTHEINYSVSDGCGNTGFCTFLFTIADCKKPTPFCQALVAEIMQTGMVPVSATQLEAGSSFDNCSSYGNLIFSFSPNVNDLTRIFDCTQLGANTVQIWATDEAGNQDFCTTSLTIQDNMNACGGVPLVAALGGGIANEENEGVENVAVELNGNATGSTLTSGAGSYQFANLPVGNDYTVTPHLDENPLNGVTTFDLLLLSRHILGMVTFDSPYKLIAADVNRSGAISTSDVVDLRKVILHTLPTFPNNTSWRFVEGAYVFPNPMNPFSPVFPEVCSVNDLTAASPATNFVAVKIGDLNGNAATSNFAGNIEDRNAGGDFALSVFDRQVKAGETVSVDFSAKLETALGCQFTLNFDHSALAFEKLTPGSQASPANFGLSLLEEGTLTASWNQLAVGNWKLETGNSDTFFTLNFTAKKDGKLSDWLNLDSRFTKAESYASDGSAGTVSLFFKNGQGISSASERFELYQNVPNPFNNATVIGFRLPEASAALLTIYDVSGKVVKEVRGQYSEGYHEISVEKSALPGNGVFYYQLETPGNVATRKMMIF